MNTNEEERSALESLEGKLYDPKGKIENVSLHHVRDRKEKELPTSWGADTPIVHTADDHEGLSFGAKFLIAATGLLVVVLLFTAWRVLSSRNIVSEKNIDMVLDITPYIEGGEATPFSVALTNRNEVALTDATLTLMYKQGTGAQDEEEKVQIKKQLGTVDSGDFKREDFEVMLFGSESESRDITVKLEYKVKGSNAPFSKVGVTQVILKSPPLSVSVSGPDMLSSGQQGVFTFTITNNTGTTSVPSLLSLALPANFTLEESTPRSSTRGTLWQVPELQAGGTYSIAVTGSLAGSQGETATMKALVGSVGGSVTQVGVVYSSQTFDVKLRTSPIVLSMSLTAQNGVSESLRYGDSALLTIRYKNGGGEPLQSAEVVLSVKGDAANMKNISVDDGYYDSVNGTITWNRASVPELATVPPGGEGLFLVTIPIVTKGTNSPKLVLSVLAKGSLKETDDVTTTFTKTYTVQGTALVSAATQYKNSSFQNTGPIPPQPNIDTTYTIRLAVSAQNALENARVSFVLPAYVSWRTVSTDSARIVYDQKTRTVSWNIGGIEAGKTIAADVGLSVRPSQVHVGKSPAITSGIVLDADEVESRAHLRTTISGVTTYIAGETWQGDPSLVVDR